MRKPRRPSIGRVEEYMRRKAESGEPLFFLLSDPERPLDPGLVRRFEEEGADVLLVGGSLNVAPGDIDGYISSLRGEGVRLPVVLFPGGLNNVAASADAILFMSLLNSLDPYWIIGVQVAAAPLVKRYGLEAIPTAYIIVGHGGAAGHIGKALPVPYENPYIAASYAAAAEMLGMRLVYLEAGSGAPRHVPIEAVELSRKALDTALLVVGGGIRSRETARRMVESGADAVVVGTLAERRPEEALEVLREVKKR